MQKIYSRTYWENFPSEKTAIDAMRLNNAEAGIDNLDDRVVAIPSWRSWQSTSSMIRKVSSW